MGIRRLVALRDGAVVLDAFHFMESVTKRHLSASNFNVVLHALCLFGEHAVEAPVHNTRVIELILSVHARLVVLSDGSEAVFAQIWLRTLRAIASFATNADYQTQRFAVNSLHRALLQSPVISLDPTSTSTNDRDRDCDSERCFVQPNKLLFQTILLPLLLQTADDFAARPEQTQTIELKLVTLIFQKWLHDLARLVHSDEQFHAKWYALLRAIKALLEKLAAATDSRNRANAKNIELHCVENIKNVILVFQSSHVFETLAQRTGTSVWNETWRILDDVAPNLKQQFIVADAVVN